MEEIASAQEITLDSFPSPPGDPQVVSAGETPPAEALTRLETALSTGFANLLQELREKVALDRFREEQVDRLHAELQTYKNDLVSKQARLLIQGIVRLHDNLGRSVAALRQKSPEEVSHETLFRQLANFQDDIELLLGQHGVEPFQTPDEEFDPRRQTVARKVPTDDPGCIGRIAERVRPGFEQGETILQKERVAVYAPDDTNDKAQGGHS
jgi:molecular chaperone GrpE